MSWAYDDVINNGGASYEQPLLLHRPSAIADVPPALHHQAADWRTPNVSVSMWLVASSHWMNLQVGVALVAERVPVVAQRGCGRQPWQQGRVAPHQQPHGGGGRTSGRGYGTFLCTVDPYTDWQDDEQLLSFVGGLATNAPLNASDE